MQWLKRITRRPSVHVLAQQELEEAKRALLEAQSGYEFAKRMADYHQDRIDHLTALLEATNGRLA